MKNLPASDTSVRKVKGWKELSPAENDSDKRAIFAMLRAKRTTR
jgi:hypothetical protein